jgi:hypothetical protein
MSPSALWSALSLRSCNWTTNSACSSQHWGKEGGRAGGRERCPARGGGERPHEGNGRASREAPPCGPSRSRGLMSDSVAGTRTTTSCCFHTNEQSEPHPRDRQSRHAEKWLSRSDYRFRDPGDGCRAIASATTGSRSGREPTSACQGSGGPVQFAGRGWKGLRLARAFGRRVMVALGERRAVRC